MQSSGRVEKYLSVLVRGVGGQRGGKAVARAGEGFPEVSVGSSPELVGKAVVLRVIVKQ